MKKLLIKVLLLSVLFSLTGCFSIGARNKMADDQITIYPGVEAYQNYVTSPFKQLNTEDSIFFGILISPHLIVATVDFPFSFIVDSIYLSSDQQKANEWAEIPKKVFNNEWPELVKNIKNTKLEDALKLIDDVGFKKFWELLRNSSEEEKILFALLKTIDEDGKSYSRKRAIKELIKFSSKDILQVMENTWWPYLIVPENRRGRHITRAAYLKDGRAKYVLEISTEDHKNIWAVKLWNEVVFIFGFPENASKSYIVATNYLYRKSYKIETFYGKPDVLKIPLVKFSKEERKAWVYGWGISKWAESYFPEDVAEHFDFVENKFGIPEVIQVK